MKTNGSMIHRQWFINNAIRDRRVPLASSPCSPHFSSVLLHPKHLFTLCSLFCLLAEADYFACEPCYSWLAGCSPAVGKELYKVLVDLTEGPLMIYSQKNVFPEPRIEELQVRPYWQPWPQPSLSNFTPPDHSFTPSCLSFFFLFYFTVFPAICHVERTGRQSKTECGTVVYLNPLMGSMGFAVLLEHWFKASSICQFNMLEAREHRNTLPISTSLVSFWVLHKNPPYSTLCNESFVHWLEYRLQNHEVRSNGQRLHIENVTYVYYFPNTQNIHKTINLTNGNFPLAFKITA